MDQTKLEMIDRDREPIFKRYPTPYELASVAAVLSLREGAENDLNQVFNQALHLLTAARQKLIDGAIAFRKADEEAYEAVRPRLLFDPHKRIDPVRAYIKDAQKGGRRGLDTISKASTLEEKLRTFCRDVEVIFGSDEKRLGESAKSVLRPDYVKDKDGKKFRKVYQVLIMQLECFVDWQRETERLKALARKGIRPSALQIWARLSAAAIGMKTTNRKYFEDLYREKHADVEEVSRQIITKLRSANYGELAKR